MAVVVTGSAGGIGGAICARIEAAGHEVIGVDVRDATVIADLSTADGREAAITAVRDATGGTLDGLVVAAGIGGSTSAPSSMVARINYFGAVALLEGLHDTLVGGALQSALAISSNSITLVPEDELLVNHLLAGDEDAAASRADELHGETVYANSKLALARKVRRLAVEWAPAVRVNAVAPGPVPTPLTDAALAHPETGDAIKSLPIPMERWSERSEIADAVWFLLGEATSATGNILFVDGGTDALVRPDAV
jgi:NAD(P)-dependent dehydrogenase (short-subunit alcohol dehydrogenase family)